MDSGYYAAMTGLVARTQALDTAAANLANAETPGYRAEREFFRSVLLGPDGPGSQFDSQLGETVNNYGLLGGDRLSMAQGALEQTGNPLDLAIEGQGFFMVQTPQGLRYTRDGSFRRAQSGQLVTQAGEPVLSPASQPIVIPPGEVAVGADGTVSVAGGTVGGGGSLHLSRGNGADPRGREPLRCAAGSDARRGQGCLRAPGRHRGRQPGCGPGIAGFDRDAAPGGDDAAGADRLPHRVQQICHGGFAEGLVRGRGETFSMIQSKTRKERGEK